MSLKQTVDVTGMRKAGPYSPAVRTGDLLFVSGQPGFDPITGELSPDAEQQIRQAFQNLATVLAAGGSSMELVVNTTIIVTDLKNFPLVNQITAEVFPNEPPARMTINAPLPMGIVFSVGCVAAVASS